MEEIHNHSLHLVNTGAEAGEAPKEDIISKMNRREPYVARILEENPLIDAMVKELYEICDWNGINAAEDYPDSIVCTPEPEIFHFLKLYNNLAAGAFLNVGDQPELLTPYQKIVRKQEEYTTLDAIEASCWAKEYAPVIALVRECLEQKYQPRIRTI